ncbi:MAG: universal stress protein [Gammaproteobacteria bacterium]
MNIIKHVLYATDDSEDALEAYQYALSLAEHYNARLTLLHVVPESSDLSVFDINMGRSTSERKWLEAKREYLQGTRDAYCKKIREEYGMDYAGADEVVVELGIPATVILLVAGDKNCDFIVMGMRGKGRTLGDAILGDTVRRVLHRSKVPVLVVRPYDESVQKDEND